MQIQENRILVEKVSIIVSQKAYGSIGQAIEGSLQDWGLGANQSEDGDLGRAPQGAFVGENEVSLLGYPKLTRYSISGIQGVKILTVKKIAHAEEFLRLSQRELHSALNTLEVEYVTSIRQLAEAAKHKRFKALRDAINLLDLRLQPKLREAIVGTRISRPREVTELY